MKNTGRGEQGSEARVSFWNCTCGTLEVCALYSDENKKKEIKKKIKINLINKQLVTKN